MNNPDALLPTRLTAADIARGTARLLLRQDCVTIPEMPLGNGRRADLVGLCRRGHITLVEIKVSRADLLGDSKWTEYLDYCDRYFWAVPAELAPLLAHADRMPERAGLIIADHYDAAILRQPTVVALAAARRKAETLRFARTAARRFLADIDDGQTALV